MALYSYGPYIVMALSEVSHRSIVMALYSYGPIQLWPYILMAPSEVSHRNIVGYVCECTEDEGGALLVTEYLADGSLFDVMRSRAADVGYDELLDLLLQLSDAIRYLHEGAPRPIVHRDLKSHNVLMDLGLRRLKICDFGTANAVERTRHHTMIGTCAWMAPEVLRGPEYSVKADVWGLGVVGWEMLTGRQPYEGIERFQ